MIITYNRVLRKVTKIRILDRGYIDGKLVLLDGCGNKLSPCVDAVYMTFGPEEMQVNSQGVPFTPPITFGEMQVVEQSALVGA